MPGTHSSYCYAIYNVSENRIDLNYMGFSECDVRKRVRHSLFGDGAHIPMKDYLEFRGWKIVRVSVSLAREGWE